VNWKEIATKFLDDEQTESEYQQEKSGETPEVDPFSDADKAELKAMGVTGSKKAMITSDTQLETPSRFRPERLPRMTLRSTLTRQMRMVMVLLFLMENSTTPSVPT